MRILALTGSLRRDSFSARLARAAADLAPEGVEVTLATGLDLPAYNQDNDVDGMEDPGTGVTPEAVRHLRDQISSADGLLIVTPEYNAGMPGFLKNALDWASRPHGSSSLAGRPAAIVSSSPMPFGGIWANQQVRKSFTITGTPTVERELAIGKVDEKIDEKDEITDGTTRTGLTNLLTDLVELVGQTEAAGEAEEDELAAA
ncbi:MAG: NAD(P)H-dependent oxidoreductase [Actinomycetota bacterium]|nr:NAD(P)H-dependent oxidoreductase [Actinomycetota bacterium]